MGRALVAAMAGSAARHHRDPAGLHRGRLGRESLGMIRISVLQ